VEDEELGLGGKLDFLEAFSALPDPRQSKKVLYPLDEVLLLTLCAVLCGADGWVSVALFGEQSSSFCAGSCLSRTARRATISSD
jgi:hypothetical protein